MSEKLSVEEIKLWENLVEKHRNYRLAIKQFFASGINRTEILRLALQQGDISASLDVLPYMEIEEITPLFENLLFLASGSRGDVEAIRQIILSLPKEWVLENIERAATPLLKGDYAEESYRRLLELYIILDENLALKLAHTAVNHSDEEIRKIGHDFLEILKTRIDK